MTEAPAGWYPESGDHATLRYWDGNGWTEHRHSTPVQSFAAPVLGSAVGVQESKQCESQVDARQPLPRLIRCPDDAELVAAEWMRFYGFGDARRTRSGADGGLDVEATGAVAQVKDHGTSIGRPVLQQLHGAAHGRQTLFFSRQGYTREAQNWAGVVGMALFRFDLQGVPEPINEIAVRVATGRMAAACESAAGANATGWFIPFCAGVHAALGNVASQRVGRFSQRERIVGVWQTWLTLHVIKYDMTQPVGRRQILRQTSLSVGLDSLTGQLFPHSKREQPPVEATLDSSLPAAYTATSLVATIEEELRRLGQLRQPAARQRMLDVLSARGLPILSIRSADASAVGALQHPTYTGILEAPTGRRVVLLDGVTGSLLDAHSRALTGNLFAVERYLQRRQRID